MDSCDLDINWIHTQTRLFHESQKINKESMKAIHIQHIFINLKSEIVKKRNSIYTSKLNETTLPSFEIFLVQENKNMDNKKYRIFEILLFNVDLDIQEDSEINSLFQKNFLHKKNLLVDTIIPPTLYIFHDINCLYLIYKEFRKSESKNKTFKLLSRQ